MRENLTYGNSRIISDKEILDSIEEFNLFAEDKPVNLDVVVSNRTLSSGQMQKISFIRSMLSDANILLLDESTSNLDIKTKQFIFQILKSKEITIINSTHNQEDFTYDDHLKIDITEKNREILVIKN